MTIHDWIKRNQTGKVKEQPRQHPPPSAINLFTVFMRMDSSTLYLVMILFANDKMMEDTTEEKLLPVLV